VEIPGGRGGLQRPPWNGNSEGVGGCKPKTFRGRGMDIFWNHTICSPVVFFVSVLSKSNTLILQIEALRSRNNAQQCSLQENQPVCQHSAK